MATLQKLRNQGPLLVIFVGLALFAFIASDAWRAIEPNSREISAGYLNGEKISAMEFQEFQNKYLDATKSLRLMNEALPEAQRTASFTDEELTALREQAWNTYIQLQIAEMQGKKLGISVTDEEIEEVLNSNSSQFMNSFNRQFKSSGVAFDALSWKEVKENYKKGLEIGRIDPYTAEMHACWEYLANNIKAEIYQAKQAALLAKAAVPNAALASKNFELNNNTFSIEVAAYPYNEIADSLVKVSDEEVKKFYDENKEYAFELPFDTRDIEYISVSINPSPSDRSKVQQEMQEYADSLKNGSTEYDRLLRMAGCDYTYNDLLWTKDALSEDVQVRLDNVALNDVVGPYSNASDNTFNVFKYLRKEEVADSMMIRLILVESQDKDILATTTDSLMNALGKNADFKELAKNYGHVDSLWFRSQNFYTVGIFNSSKIQEEVYNAPTGKYAVAELTPNAKIIYQVITKKGKAEVYNIAYIKKEIATSNETYDNIYNKLSEYIATYNTAEQFRSEAFKNGYVVRPQNDVNASTAKIGNIANTSSLINWILSDERTEGEFSAITECGNNNNFIVAVITGINPKGYLPLKKATPSITNKLTIDKKAEMITNELAGKDFAAICGNNKVKTSSISMVEYKKATHVPSVNADEPVISAVVANMNVNEVSAPIKGNNAVYVVKVTAKNPKNGEFNAETENQYISSNGGMFSYDNIAGQLLQMALSDIYPAENKLHTMQSAQ